MQARTGRRRPPPAAPPPRQATDPSFSPAFASPAGQTRSWRAPESQAVEMMGDESREIAAAGVEIEGEATPVPTLQGDPAADRAVPATITDQRDEVIAAGLDTLRLAIAAGETGIVRLALLNNGDRHAQFQIHVEGWIDEQWVRITYSDQEELGAPSRQLWLHPAERALLTIAITPPRTPSSTAGERPFAVVIRTADYGARQCRLGALLTIQPYTGLLLGQLIQHQPVTNWRRRTARLVLPVTNRGNVAAQLFVQGHDARRQCHVSFRVPGAERWQLRRATFTVPPGKTVQIGLRITPPAPPLIGLRSRTAEVGLAVGYLKAANTPLPATAVITTQPVIGPWLLAALCALCTLVAAGALLLTTATAMLASRDQRTPVVAQVMAQPTPLPPQIITIVVHLAQPAPVGAPSAGRTESSAVLPLPVIDADAPIVRPEQVTAPGTPYRASTFHPVAPPADTQTQPRSSQAPFTYQQMFEEIALQYDLNWRVLAAQAYLESGFDSLALSNSGAMGLMQILPGTWREWAPAVAANDPFDAYSSALVAAVYLDHLRSELGKRGHPQIEWMLVAYNWGIDRLVEHLEAGRTWDDLPATSRQYAEDILRIAQTIPLD
ncbi:MAG: hypothetical protein DCC55_18490 [Chloroflexi bacterium]|nr:MAG: hypothetical protein DCC55_18490 [Chloroflexota bacterium]